MPGKGSHVASVNPNYYDPARFWTLPQDVQQKVLNSLAPAQRATFMQTLQQFQQGQSGTSYQDPLGTLLNSLFGSGLFSGAAGGSSGGHGGGGGGGSGPSGQVLTDAGLQLGLARDKLLAQQGHESNSHDAAVKNQMIQQLGLDLQKNMAKQNYGEQRYGLTGSSAARGSLTTAGTAHKFGVLGQQFNDLMKQYGFQQQQQDVQNSQLNNDWFYQNQQNNFDKQSLNLQTSPYFQHPFSNPNPNPVARV